MTPEKLLYAAVISLHEEVLLAQPRYQDPRALAPWRAPVFSQNGEDGMIAEVFRRIGAPSRTFIEIGAGNGQQNNTRFLLECGWRGVWCEADPANAAAIRFGYAEELRAGRLLLVDTTVTRENVAGLLGSLSSFEPDLMSIDIDMNTSHVWRALTLFRPRLVVVEYNAVIPPSVEWEVDYDPAAVWTGDNRFGASLKRLERIGAELGYRLVGCEPTGINAFFVRADLAGDLFVGPPTAERHYEPLRFSLLLRPRHIPWARPAASPVAMAA